MHNFKNLKVWEKAMHLVEDVYKLTALMPESEKLGLTSQIRRSAVSIPSNIAEGAGRSSNKDFVRFLYMSLGSANEMETQLELAKILGFLKNSELSTIESQLNEIQKMCNKLIQRLS